ncbi:MAG: hypothetical protein ABIJ61_13765 [bacterium]
MMRKLALLPVLIIALLLVGCSSDDQCASCPQTGAIIYITTHKVDFGDDQTSGVFSIINKGEKALSWSISVSNAPWLSLSAVSGTDDATITLTASRSLLTQIGAGRAIITISSNAINAETEEIEVYILNAGEWLDTDTGVRDSCRAADEYDYYWLKGFALPDGSEEAFIDSVSFNVCDVDTVFIVAFSADWRPEGQLWLPSSVIYASDAAYVLPDGWGTIPLNLYTSEPLIFIGFAKASAAGTGPRPGVGATVEADTVGSGRVFQDPADPDFLYWETFDDPMVTLLIRAFISPVIEYNPKLAPADSRYYENLLAERMAERGARPVSILPRIR